MLARSKPHHMKQYTSTKLPSPMYVSASKHRLQIQQIERSRTFIANTSPYSHGLKSVSVNNEVLTFTYADNDIGMQAGNALNVKKYIKDMRYGQRHDESHDLWHMGKKHLDQPHIHVIKTSFDSKTNSKLVTAKEFELILSDMEKNPVFLKQEDATQLKVKYARFYEKNTQYCTAKKFILFAPAPKQKTTVPALTDGHERINKKKLTR